MRNYRNRCHPLSQMSQYHQNNPATQMEVGMGRRLDRLYRQKAIFLPQSKM
jgi:hypothetical protein